jgi:hypothetical protein
MSDVPMSRVAALVTFKQQPQLSNLPQEPQPHGVDSKLLQVLVRMPCANGSAGNSAVAPCPGWAMRQHTAELSQPRSGQPLLLYAASSWPR